MKNSNGICSITEIQDLTLNPMHVSISKIMHEDSKYVVVDYPASGLYITSLIISITPQI